MFRKSLYGTTAMAAAALLSASAPAWGTIVFEAGPGNVTGDELVQFNDDLPKAGTLIQGLTNQTAFTVDFSGAGESLKGTGGQATLAGADGSIRALTVSLADPDASFTSLIYNLDAAAKGTVTFTVDQVDGPDETASFDLGKGGQNFFEITAIHGQRIDSVTFDTNVDVTEVTQVRIGGVEVAVPEPGALGILSLGGIALLRRRRRA